MRWTFAESKLTVVEFAHVRLTNVENKGTQCSAQFLYKVVYYAVWSSPTGGPGESTGHTA